MGRIAVIDNPFRPREARIYGWSGPIIDWLQREYPNGFECGHQLLVNRELVAVADYDREIGEQDEALLVLLPGTGLELGPILATALLTAAASVAINFAFSVLFPSKSPASELASSKTPTAGSVYSISVPTNQAKLGDPIPVIYGHVLSTPDIATQPWTYYANNDMYLCMLLCLGHGEFDIHDLYVSSSPVSQLASGIFTHVVYPPGSHLQTMGTIESTFPRIDWVPFFENVDTSPEVADQELIPSTTDLSRKAMIDESGSVHLVSKLRDGIVVGDLVSFPGLITPINARFWTGPWSLASVSSDRRTITLNKVSDGTLQLGYVDFTVTNTVAYSRTVSTITITWAGASPFPAWIKQTGVNSEPNKMTLVIGGNTVVYSGSIGALTATSLTMTSPVVVSGTEPVPSNGPVTSATIRAIENPGPYDFYFRGSYGTTGPFMVGAPGERVRQIQVDVTWPGGLYRGNEDGSLTTNCVFNRVLIEQVDDLGNVLGTVVDGSADLCASTNTPQRRTYAWNVDPNFRYRVSMEQTNVTSDRAMDAYKCYWTGLKGVLVNETAPVYGDTTLIAIRMKATNGLASDATRRVGVDCTRRLPSGKPSHDPAAVFEDIYVNKNYGARRPSIELDQTALAAVSAAAAGHNGFNAIFDFRTTVWDAGVAALAPVRASPVTYWAQVSAIIDQPQTLVRWSFTEDNIVKDSIEFGWQFTQIDEQDSVEVEYRRIDDWVAHYVRYPTGGVDPEQVNLLGCTDKATAAAHAKYLWQRKQYRRKMVKFSTEMEGHLPQLGDLIRVTHRMNGTEDYVVGSISPAAGLQVQIEAYRYQSEVYA